MKTALLMLMALPLLAVGPVNDRFSGRIFDIDGTRQLADAIITVTTPAGYVASVNTNKAGEFSFPSLPSGEYNFRVTAHGYAIYERPITLADDFGVRELTVRMLVPANKQTVSVAELRNPNVTRIDPSVSGTSRRGY
jgi:hypothetical protein